MKDLVHRSGKAYSEIRMAAINDLDRMASALLAICYSGHRAPTPASQRRIQFDCVAVCQVGEDLWVAANGIGIQNEDIDELLELMKKEKYFFNGCFYIVTQPGREAMHAEMKLLSELCDATLHTSYIGVSKPCCKYCKEYLNTAGISYAQWHDKEPTDWIDPFW